MSRECAIIRPMIFERTDGKLDPGRSLKVEQHLAQCAECKQFGQELQSLGGLLRTLPRQQTSVGFEARLAERLAQRTQPKSRWWYRLADAWTAQPLLRPALALGAAALILGVYSLTPSHITTATMPTPVSSDQALLTQCVDQHQSDIAAQPLSDPAAQNLAAHLDNTTAGLTISSAIGGAENP